MTLQDPSKIKVYTWYNTGSQGNCINEYGTEGRSSYSTDRAKSASFRVERKDEWEISENKDITSNKNALLSQKVINHMCHKKESRVRHEYPMLASM